MKRVGCSESSTPARRLRKVRLHTPLQDVIHPKFYRWHESNYHCQAASYREVIDRAMREYRPYDPPKPEYPELTEIRFDRACVINGVHVPAGTVWKRDPSPADIESEQ